MNYPDPELDLRRNSRSGGWPGPNSGRQKRRQMIVIGVALVGVILFATMLWQVYRLGKMTGSEEAAPLIHADDTPTKIRPEQPGGITIPDQDKTVFDRMNGSKPATVENLLDLPEEPVERPAVVDSTASSAQNSTSASAAATSDNAQSETAEAESLFPSKPDPEAMTAPAVSAEDDSTSPSEDAEPLAQAPPEQLKPLEPVPTEQVAVITSKPVPGQVSSPTTKPAVPATVKKPVKPTSSSPTPPTSVQPTPAGQARLQIAAVRSEADARAAVSRLQKQFPDDLGPLPFRINRVEIAQKGIFYRIQAGPLPDSQAKTLCDKLKAKGLGCMVVK